MPSLIKRLSLHSLRCHSSKDKDRSLTASHDAAESSHSPPPVPPLRTDPPTSSPFGLTVSGSDGPPLRVASPPDLVNRDVARVGGSKSPPPPSLPSPPDASALRQAVDAPLAQVWRGLDAQETVMKPGKIDSAVSALVANSSASLAS
jgi:hypothetical protein